MSAVNENLKQMFSKLEDHITTKTVVGEPVQLGNVILIPLVDVMIGMGTGLSGKADNKETGGSAFGAKMSPSAVVAIVDGNVQLVNLKSQESTNKLIDMIPGILSKFNLGGLFGNKDKKTDEEVKPKALEENGE